MRDVHLLELVTWQQ